MLSKKVFLTGELNFSTPQARLRLAARCAQVLAHAQFEIGEIIAKCPDHDTKLSPKNLLDDASVAEPGAGQP